MLKWLVFSTADAPLTQHLLLQVAQITDGESSHCQTCIHALSTEEASSRSKKFVGTSFKPTSTRLLENKSFSIIKASHRLQPQFPICKAHITGV